MIVDYDRNPQLSVDRKMTSLCESIQRAINELQDEIQKLQKAVSTLTAQVEKQQKEINDVVQQNNLGE